MGADDWWWWLWGLVWVGGLISVVRSRVWAGCQYVHNAVTNTHRTQGGSRQILPRLSQENRWSPNRGATAPVRVFRWFFEIYLCVCRFLFPFTTIHHHHHPHHHHHQVQGSFGLLVFRSDYWFFCFWVNQKVQKASLYSYPGGVLKSKQVCCFAVCVWFVWCCGRLVLVLWCSFGFDDFLCVAFVCVTFCVSDLLCVWLLCAWLFVCVAFVCVTFCVRDFCVRDCVTFCVRGFLCVDFVWMAFCVCVALCVCGFLCVAFCVRDPLCVIFCVSDFVCDIWSPTTVTSNINSDIIKLIRYLVQMTLSVTSFLSVLVVDVN